MTCKPAIPSTSVRASANVLLADKSAAGFHIPLEALTYDEGKFIRRSLRAYTARQLSGHAARVMNSQGLPPAAGRDKQDVFLDLMSQVGSLI